MCTSSMPGPSSRPTTTMPWRSPSSSSRNTISPRRAYRTMLRAISEIAVAISVRSVLENPSRAASALPWARAVRTSRSEPMSTRSSFSTVAQLPLLEALKQRQSFLEVERGGDALQVQPQLDHREGDLGLDADDHRLGAAQAGHVGDAPQRARGEGVHDVQGRDVDDDAPGAEGAHPLEQVVPQLQHVAVTQLRLDRGDQVRPLFEDRNRHRVPPSAAPAFPRP